MFPIYKLETALFSSTIIAAVAALPSVVAPTMAFGAETMAVEEIVVSARRRDESLQDVPIAVTAYSGEALEKAGVIDILHLTQSVPNTTLKASRATNSTLTAFIRGVGQQDPLAGFEPGVGIYLDDVYLARPQGTVFDVYDVERVEILRGPQGTLYGRNTIGGALKYVTRRLGDEPMLKLRTSAGTYGQLDVVATASLPVSDTLRIGGSVARFSRNGFGENLFTHGENYDKDIVAVRASVEWSPSEDIFVRLAADYSNDDSSPKGGHRLMVGNLSGAPVLDDVFDTRSGAEVNASTAGIDGNQEVTQKGVGLTAEWNVNETVTLKSITSYREDYTESVIDFDSLPSNDFDAPVIYDNWQFSEELQLLYQGERLNGILGFYYLKANASDDFDVVLGNLFGGLTAFTRGDVDTKTWSIFGDATYDISDAIGLSLGGRYTSDKRTALVLRETYFGIGSPYFGNTSAIFFRSDGSFTGEKTFKEFTPRVSINWQPTDEHNLYVTYSKGFKSGGFDPRGNQVVFPGVADGYKPEIVDSYEVGIKSRMLDERVATNIAAFYMDYSDQQIPGSVAIDVNGDGINDGFAGTVTNAGSSKYWGLEFEGVAQVTDDFKLAASVGYIHAEFKEFILNGVDLADQRVVQNTPKWTTNLTATYEVPVNIYGNDGSLALIAAWSYKSLTHQFETANTFLDQPAYSLFDASVVWTSDNGRYQAGIHGKNLSDKKYVVAGYNFPTLGREGSVTTFYGDPRTVTATFQVNF